MFFSYEKKKKKDDAYEEGLFKHLEALCGLVF